MASEATSPFPSKTCVCRSNEWVVETDAEEGGREGGREGLGLLTVRKFIAGLSAADYECIVLSSNCSK